MDYSQQFEYLSFLAERTNQQAHMERIINEAVLIGEGTNNIENIQLIQESFSDKVKDVVSKLLNFIGKLWGKFIEAMNTLIKNDKAYLERYKDIILKKKVVDDLIIYDYYNGGIQLLLNDSCPALEDNDINADEDNSPLDSKDKFIKSKFQKFTKYGKGPYESLTDLATAAFRGGGQEVDKPAANVNMTDMYNYCLNYGSLKDKIQRDINTFQEAQKKFDAKLATMNNNSELKQESVLDIFDNKKYYSEVFEQYITEEDTNKPDNQVDPKDAINNGMKEGQAQQKEQDAKKAENNNQTVNNGNTASAYQQTNADNKDANVEKNKNTYNVLQKRAQVYFEICGQYFAAKLSIAQEAEKKFMQVIKNHVRHYVGTNDEDDNQAAKGNTNLNTGNSDNKQQNDNSQQQNDNDQNKDNNQQNK